MGTAASTTMLFLMANSSLLISPEEFKLFHEMDRRLYTLLTKDLRRDPLESMKVMALWLWLERSGFNNVVKKILSLPHFLINELADEAVTCLNCLNNSKPFLSLPEPNDIPLTQNVIDKEVSLQYFHQKCLTAIQGISKVATEVCARALTDIMEQAIERNFAQHLAETKVLMSSLVQPDFDRLRIGGVDFLRPQTKAHEVPPDDRTMFVTFSKGYPVAEREIRDFFVRTYGDCIETLYMQEVQPGEQSLFARIVFYSASSIKLVLNGVDKVKFTINGKHVWMRKFVPKRLKTSSPPPSQPDMPSASVLPS